MRMKLRIDQINSRHVHLSVFSDPSVTNNGTFAHLGRLIMEIGEYQSFGCALGLGAAQMRGSFVLMPEDPKFKEWADKEAKDER
jgi:hypothetical protein